MTFIPHLASRARRELVQRFEAADATVEERAIRLDDLPERQKSRLRRLVENHIVHEAQPGTYWLDRHRYALEIEHRRRLAFLAAIVVLIVLFFVVEIAGRV
jgi:hypothetical protein